LPPFISFEITASFAWQGIGRATKRNALFKECTDGSRSRLQELMIELPRLAMWDDYVR